MTSMSDDATSLPPAFSSAAPKLTALIVDDELDIRELLSILLVELGYATITAADGVEALDIFQARRPDIVLTDIKMPGKDGIAVLKDIKAEFPEIEVIMLSGHGDMHLVIQSLKHDAADFITKPIDEELLGIALRKVSERISMRREVRAYTENLEHLVRKKSAALVEIERKLAAKQIMEGMGQALAILSSNAQSGATAYFTGLPFYVAIHDRERQVVTANEAYSQRFGNRIGRNSCGVYRDCVRPDWKSPVFEAAEARAAVHRQEILLDMNGNELPVISHVSPVIDAGGELELLLEVAVDVSEMHRLQEELAQTQRKFEYFFNMVPCSITVQDRNLMIVEANETFRRDFGDPQGRTCHELYKHSDVSCSECPVLATFEDGALHQHETVVTTLAGERRNILVWTAPVSDASGQVTHVLKVATDITQIRELQDNLSSLGIMLGSMSHGVKGMLMAIDGGAYRVDKGLEKGDMQRIQAGWKTVRHRLEHMRRTVMDILYYSKSREPELKRCDLLMFAQHLAETVAAKALKAGITLEMDFVDAVGTIDIDEVALSSAMVNFLENAVDACLFDRANKDRRIHLRVVRKDGKAIFTIADNGIGMDRETLDKMFTLFFSSKGALGTGIGMFVSHHIITKHGGTINVESEEGVGTTFRIVIPMAPPLPPQSYDHAAPAA